MIEPLSRRTLFRHPLAAVGGALFVSGGFFFLLPPISRNPLQPSTRVSPGGFPLPGRTGMSEFPGG